MPNPAFLSSHNPPHFPNVETALRRPNGLLAIGGALNPNWLMAAYQAGIFPWMSADEPICWFAPDPRCVLFLDQLHTPKRWARTLRQLQQKGWEVRLDTDFAAVIRHCAYTPRGEGNGVWIDRRMQQAYLDLHEAGFAHSVEVWHENQLIGGLYGVAVGGVFAGESMFSLQPSASRFGFYWFCEYLKNKKFIAIDAQIASEHLIAWGACSMMRSEYSALLAEYGAPRAEDHGKWVI